MRNDIYKTDCDCKKNVFQDFKESIRHLESCKKAKKIFYNSAYGDPILIRVKEYEKGIQRIKCL